MPNQVSQLNAVTRVDIDNDNLMVVDTSDTTDGSGGSNRRLTPYHLMTSRVPTAAELSGDGTELQEYLDDEFARTDTFGGMNLPEGDITYSGTVECNQKAGFRLHGDGAKKNSTPQDLTNGWDAVAIGHGTRLIYTGAQETPAIKLAGVASARISDFAIEHQNGGDCFLLTNSGAFATAFVRFGNLKVSGDSSGNGTGFRAEAGGGILQADVSFDAVHCKDLNEALVTEGGQTVVFNWTNTSYFSRVDTVAHCVQGGGVNFFGCAANGIGTLVRTDAGGKNARGFGVFGVGLDRTGGAAFPIVLDATRAAGKVVFACNVLDVKYESDETPDSHDFFRLNDGYAAAGCVVSLGANNLQSIGTDAHRRIGLYSAAQVRSGEVLGNINVA